MSAINNDITAAKQEVERIIGNVKGGFIVPLDAVETIHKMYLTVLDNMRYPSEPKLLTGQSLTADELEMANHFSQADKNK